MYKRPFLWPGWPVCRGRKDAKERRGPGWPVCCGRKDAKERRGPGWPVCRGRKDAKERRVNDLMLVVSNPNFRFSVYGETTPESSERALAVHGRSVPAIHGPSNGSEDSGAISPLVVAVGSDFPAL